MTLHKSVSLFGISIGRGVVLCLCFTWLVAEVVIGKLAQCGCGTNAASEVIAAGAPPSLKHLGLV